MINGGDARYLFSEKKIETNGFLHLSPDRICNGENLTINSQNRFFGNFEQFP